MTVYLLTAAGVIFLTVIVSFIIPDGKLNKSVNFILRIVCIGVLMQPVTTIFRFSDVGQTSLADYDYICDVYSRTQSEALEKNVLENLGLECECIVNVTFDDAVINEKGVAVYIYENDAEKVTQVYEYLQSLGYINITVNEKGN